MLIWEWLNVLVCVWLSKKVTLRPSVCPSMCCLSVCPLSERSCQYNWYNIFCDILARHLFTDWFPCLLSGRSSTRYHIVAYQVVYVGPHTDSSTEGVGRRPTSVLNGDGQRVSSFLPFVFSALHGVSVCPSVRPFVKRMHCDKTEERSIQIFVPYERSFTLVFWEKEWFVGATPSSWNFVYRPASQKTTIIAPLLKKP